jgi:hypothetical protein
MPYKYFPPEIIMKVDNVTIYYTYKDGESRNTYWFTDLKEDCDEDHNRTQFDIRESGAWKRVTSKQSFIDQNCDEETAIRWALFEGIMCGEIGDRSV